MVTSNLTVSTLSDHKMVTLNRKCDGKVRCCLNKSYVKKGWNSYENVLNSVEISDSTSEYLSLKLFLSSFQTLERSNKCSVFAGIWHFAILLVAANTELNSWIFSWILDTYRFFSIIYFFRICDHARVWWKIKIRKWVECGMSVNRFQQADGNCRSVCLLFKPCRAAAFSSSWGLMNSEFQCS